MSCEEKCSYDKSNNCQIERICEKLNLRYYDKSLFIMGEDSFVSAIAKKCSNVSGIITYSLDFEDRNHYLQFKFDSNSYVIYFDGVSENAVRHIKQQNAEIYSFNEYEQMLASLKQRPCQLKTMHLGPDGGVYICKLMDGFFKIGDISDVDIIEKIRNYQPERPCFCNKYLFRLPNGQEKAEPLHLKRLYLDFGGPCQSQCSHCFQYMQEDCRKPYVRYDDLLDFCKKITNDETIVYGGEVLVQPETLNFIRRYRTISNAKIRLNTNACVDTKMIGTVTELFDSVSITMNGFSQGTVKTIMNVDYGSAVAFAESLSKEGAVLTLKYLASPLNIHEVPAFLNWAFSLKPYRISIKITDVYNSTDDSPNEWNGTTLSHLNMAYWKLLFERIGASVNRILSENHHLFCKGGIRLSLQEELVPALKINPDFLKDIDITKIA